METKKTIKTNEEIYGDFKLIPLNLDAVNQRVEFFEDKVKVLLDVHFMYRDDTLMNKYIKHSIFWQGIKENHCEKISTEDEELTYAEHLAGKEKIGALDMQVGGNHYKNMAIQPIDFIIKNNIPYREANVIKYITRHNNKNGIQDLKKAMHYIDMIIEDYKK